MVAQSLFANRAFGLTVSREEPLLEVVAEVADQHLSVTFGVDYKLLFGDELRGGGGGCDRANHL